MKETAFDRMIRWGKDRGWNQSAIASHLRVLPQHISNWKKRGIPPEWYGPIAQLYGRSVDELIGLNGEDRKDAAQWPFTSIDENKVRSLDDQQRAKLERAILHSADAVSLDIKKD